MPTINPHFSPLQLVWNYADRDYKKDTQDISNLWKSKLSRSTSIPIKPIESIESTEYNHVREIMSLSEEDILQNIESIFKNDITVYHKVRDQLLSLLMVWERLLHEKNQYDLQKTRPIRAMDLDYRTALLACAIIPNRSNIGIGAIIQARHKHRDINPEGFDVSYQQPKSVHKLSKRKERDNAIDESDSYRNKKPRVV